MQGGFRRMRRNLQRIWRGFHDDNDDDELNINPPTPCQ